VNGANDARIFDPRWLLLWCGYDSIARVLYISILHVFPRIQLFLCVFPACFSFFFCFLLFPLPSSSSDTLLPFAFTS
jgi:hypothetical protein